MFKKLLINRMVKSYFETAAGSNFVLDKVFFNFFQNATNRYLFFISMSSVMLFGCKSMEAPTAFNKRIISNTEFKEQFFITDATPVAKKDVSYYWFKSQQVHTSQEDYAGELIHGVYTKYYYNNQVAEKGTFNKGLKTGLWNSWDAQGNLTLREKWKNGKRSGQQVTYDSINKIGSRGNYIHGKRSGKWIFPSLGDTVVYKKGAIYKPKVRDTLKLGIFQKLFKKKDSLATKENKKPTFFQRIFKKQETSAANNKKKTKSRKSSIKQNTTKVTKNNKKGNKKNKEKKTSNFQKKTTKKTKKS